MLTIITTILKILLIALLLVLGVLLVFILLALFYPVSYKAEGNKDTESVSLKLKASWCLGMIRVYYSYPQPGKVLVKVLCFTVYDSAAEPKEPKTKKTKDAPKDKPAYHPAINTSLLMSAEEEQTARVSVQNTSTEAQTHADASVSEEDSQGLLTKILCSLRKIYDKIKHIRNELEFYKRLYDTPEATKLIQKIYSKVRRIILNLLPKKLDADILLGTGSPDTTGYAMAIYGLISPYLGNKVCFTPDFENTILEGRFYLKGRLRLNTIIAGVLAVLLDPNFRIVRRRIKKHIAKINKTVNAG